MIKAYPKSTSPKVIRNINSPLTKPPPYPPTYNSTLLSTISLYHPHCRFINSPGSPTSTLLPSCITIIRSKSLTVLNRCAITINVYPCSFLLIVLCTITSVAGSTALVASSMMRIFGLARSARAKVRSWRCPREMLDAEGKRGVWRWRKGRGDKGGRRFGGRGG